MCVFYVWVVLLFFPPPYEIRCPVTQAVSHRLPPRSSESSPGLVHMGFVVYEIALYRVSSKYLVFPVSALLKQCPILIDSHINNAIVPAVYSSLQRHKET